MPTVTYNWNNSVSDFPVNFLTNGNQINSTIAAINGGSYYLSAWDDGAGDIVGQFTRANGTAGGSNFTTNWTTAGAQTDPSIAQLPGDNFFYYGSIVVTYTDTSADAGGNILARFIAAGPNVINPNTPPGQLGTEITVAGGSERDSDSDVTALASGGFVVTYTRDNGNGDLDVRGTIFNQDASVRVPLFSGESATGIAGSNSQVVGLANGNFVVTWQQQPVGGGSTSAWFQVYGSNGETVVAARAIDAGGSVNEDIQLVALRDGGFAVAYADNGWAGSDGTEITLRIYNADGSARTDNIRVNSDVSGSQGNPGLTVLANGTLVVGWTSGTNGYYQAYTPSGSAVLGNFLAATDTLNWDIAGLQMGLVASVRESSSSDGSGTSIHSSVSELVRNIVGDGSSEVLSGDGLRDFIDGLGGNDIITGGGGSDVLTGGGGDDRFRDTLANTNGDTITDFGLGDRIQITDVNPATFRFDTATNSTNVTGFSLTLSTSMPGHIVSRASADSSGVELVLRVTRNDFNGDGHSDILWRNDNGTLTNWLGQDGGNFVGNYESGVLSLPEGWTVIGTGDFNGDGRTDVLWRHENGTITDWLAQEKGVFRGNFETFNVGVGADWTFAGTGDFNGDGRADALWRKGDGSLVSWWGNQNGSFTLDNPLPSITSDWHVAGTGDFDGDGRDDILWRNDNGTVTNWRGQADGSFVGNYEAGVLSLENAWKLVGTGDFNGDGRDDVLWLNDNGVLTNWLGTANGSFQGNYANAAYQVAAGLELALIGDINGDGRDDLVWRDADSVVTDWLANSDGSFNSSPAVAIPISTDWHVTPGLIFVN